MAAECSIDKEGIKQGIQDNIAKSLDVSKLFNRVSPTADMSAILEDVKKYAPDVVAVARPQFLSNPEGFLRELAEQTTSSPSEAEGALGVAGLELVSLADKYYNQNLFSPKDLSSPYKDIIQSINNQYSSEVIRRITTGEESPIYKVDPSDSLVDIYERAYTQENLKYADSRQRISDEDYSAIVSELGLTALSTPQEFIDENMQEYSKQIANFRKANPDFTLVFTDEDSLYDANKNQVQIDLTELNGIAIRNDVPLKQVVSIYLLHEMAHAASYKAIKVEDNRSALGQLYLAAINHHNQNIPFEDVMRQGYEEVNGRPYAFENMHEFVAEAFSNPYFQEYLQSIPYEGEKSLLQTIWDTILKFFGFDEKTKPSLYDEVVRFVNSEKVQKDNRDSVDHPSTEWDPQLIYRGTPKTYSQAAFELFTSPHVTNDINKVMAKLPAAITKIKQQLDYETDKDKIKKLRTLLDAFNDVKENDDVIYVSINMLVQAGVIARDMEQQLLEIPKLDDDSKKLTLAYSLLRNVEALEFIQPLAEDVLRIIKREGETAAIRPFMTQLNGIISTVSSVKNTYVEVAQPLILKRLTEFVGETEAEKTITQEIETLKKRKKNEKDPVMQGFIERQIALKEDLYKLVPNKTNLDLIFSGQYRDASMGQLLFEAGMMNDHPIPIVVMKIIRQNNIAVSQYMLNVSNEHQRELDLLRKELGYGNIRSTDDFFKPIQPLVSRADTVVEDENGQIVYENGKPKFSYTTQKMLLSSYSPDYIKDASEKKALIDYYYKKLSATSSDDVDALKLYRDKLNQAYKERRDFMRENSENQYTEEILQMYDLLEKEIKKDDGTVTTFAKERGYIFEDIEEAEQRREHEIVLETLTKLQEEIDGLYIKQKQLKSKYDEETGLEKTGFEKELSDVANQYAELKAKYGKYELTERGEAMFEKEKLSLEQRLNNGFLTPEDYKKRLNEISVTELSEDYHDTVKYLLGRMDEISAQLVNAERVDESGKVTKPFQTVFKGVNSQLIKDGYAKIRDLVKGFRDSELIIDGQLFSKLRPELVKEIQKIQQEVENLKNAAEKLKGLSVQEAVSFKALREKEKLGVISEDELDELATLRGKAQVANALYLEFQELIDEYKSIASQFGEMNESTPSKYYDAELDHQKSVLVSQKTKEILEDIKKLDSLEGGKYIKDSGKWYEVTNTLKDGTPVVKEIDKTGFKTEKDALADKIAREQTEDDIKETEWWKNNHYDKYIIGKQGFQLVDAPIYIWVKTEPKDKSYILSEQPSIKFKTYKIHDGTNGTPNYHNPNFSIISDNIPVPKAGKYVNKEYDRMKNSSASKDKAYFRYLEFARKSFRRAQEFIPEERRLGDILPSFVKTSDELSVERTNNIASKSMQMLQGQFAAAFATDQTLDEQSVTGGSTTDFFAKNRVLPIRFSGRMDHNKQSSDIAAMILSYELAAAEYNQQLEDQPLLEAIRIAVEELPVQQSKNLASKFSMANLFASIKSAVSSQAKPKQITSEKKTEKSNLSKTVDHMLSTHVYGETKTSANVTVGGMDFDLNKASRGLKKISSLSIFALNAFVAVKNTVSATIQGNINANIGKGFFTKRQYNQAHIEAIGHVKDFLLDYRKFGNKTKIGQEMDFFQVLQGASYNEFGQKTAWTALKNSESFLTAIKNSSEFELQVAQYLAMSKANPVQLADGKWVEMRKAFEINSKGDLVLVAGANITQKQIEAFIFKLGYVNRVINGAYRAEEKNLIQKNILGDLAFYLNGYVIPGIVNRFGKTRYSAEADMITRGYINQLFSFMGDLIRYRTDINKKWSVMSVDEKNRVLRGTKEIAAIIGMALLVMALGGAKDKKELQQNQAIANWALSLAFAVKTETETFVPIPSMGLNDMARKANSPFAAVRQISNMIKTLQNFTLYLGDKMGIDASSAYYKSSSIKDGFHDKGDPKFVANFLKLVGWSGIAFDPVEKALQQRNMQTLR